MSADRLPRPLALVATAVLAAGLSACVPSGGEEETSTAEATSSPTSSSAVPAEPESSPTSTDSATSTPPSTTEPSAPSSDTTSPRGTRNAGEQDQIAEEVIDVAEEFATLAPVSLFVQFDSCHPTGLEGSYECSGPEVGQFQFFDSQSKAASTTQLLTELRSSRVVEDTGRRVVGWSTLGTTAVITVVDNDLGLVMQQLVSSDIVEPEKHIMELGLVESSPTPMTSTSRDDAAAEFSTAEERREA